MFASDAQGVQTSHSSLNAATHHLRSRAPKDVHTSPVAFYDDSDKTAKKDLPRQTRYAIAYRPGSNTTHQRPKGRPPAP